MRQGLFLCAALLVAGAADTADSSVADDSSRLTEQEREFETGFFAEVDTNKDQLWQRDELKAYFVAQELGYSEEDLDMVVGYYYKDKDGVMTDSDGDDAISWNEYLGLKLRQKQRMAKRYAKTGAGEPEIRVIAEDGVPTEAASQSQDAPSAVVAEAREEPAAATPRWDEL